MASNAADSISGSIPFRIAVRSRATYGPFPTLCASAIPPDAFLLPRLEEI
jgi:hypothetical protein